MPEPDLIELFAQPLNQSYHREGGSEKHLRDIRAMLAISADQLDRPALQDWIGRLGLETEWQRAAG